MLFGFLIVYDTQQIFGSASASFGGGKRDLEYTLDMQLGVLCLWWKFLERWHCSRKLLKCLADTNRYCRDLDETVTWKKHVWKVQIVLIYFNGTTHVMNIMSFQVVFFDLGMPWRPGICTWISWTSSSTFFSCWVKGDSWVWRKSPTSCTGCTGMDVESSAKSAWKVITWWVDVIWLNKVPCKLRSLELLREQKMNAPWEQVLPRIFCGRCTVQDHLLCMSGVGHKSPLPLLILIPLLWRHFKIFVTRISNALIEEK